jgi:hypothetical protein
VYFLFSDPEAIKMVLSRFKENRNKAKQKFPYALLEVFQSYDDIEFPRSGKIVSDISQRVGLISNNKSKRMQFSNWFRNSEINQKVKLLFEEKKQLNLVTEQNSNSFKDSTKTEHSLLDFSILDEGTEKFDDLFNSTSIELQELENFTTVDRDDKTNVFGSTELQNTLRPNVPNEPPKII